MKDLPQTNYSLLKLQTLLKSKQGDQDLIEKYKVVNVDRLLKIEEMIHRDHAPNTLILHGIYGSELIYKEEQNIFGEQKEPKMYSFNRTSFLRNYLSYQETSPNIELLRKFEN